MDYKGNQINIAFSVNFATNLASSMIASLKLAWMFYSVTVAGTLLVNMTD